MDTAALLDPSAITAFVEILLIDLVLAGDNAIVVGALAAATPLPFVWKTPETLRDILYFSSLGVIGAMGHYFVARALAYAPANDPKSRVVVLKVPGGGEKLSRKQIDSYTDFVAQYGAKGLAWIKINDLAAGMEVGMRDTYARLDELLAELQNLNSV